MHSKLSILAALGLAAAACGGNSSPTAEAGTDQTGSVGVLVTLDGSRSQDDGSLQYSWTLIVPSGSDAQLSSPSSARPSFTPDEEGTYQARLVVRDSEGTEDEDMVTISVIGGKPTADCGTATRTVDVDEEVKLDGGGSKANGADGDLDYKWELSSKPSDSDVEIEDGDAQDATFTPDQEGTYKVKLTVRADGEEDTAICTIKASGEGGNDDNGDDNGDDDEEDDGDDEE